MFLQRHFICFVTIICSVTLAAIHDEAYIIQHGPFGLTIFSKNDSFGHWVRVPEVHYKQWIYALKVWRTCSIVLGIFCLIFAALVLIYIIYGFRTDSPSPFDCFGEVQSPDDHLISSTRDPSTNLPVALQHHLKRIQQQSR